MSEFDNIKYLSNYISDIDNEYKKEFFEKINNYIELKNEKVCFSTAALFIRESFDMQGSLLSCFFSEYLAIKVNGNSNPVNKLEGEMHNHISDILEKKFQQGKLYPVFNISSATIAIFCSVLSLGEIGDSVLVISEKYGGHYSQGSNSSCGRNAIIKKLFDIHEFTLNQENNLLDYNILKEKIKEIKPKILLLGFSSYSRLIDYKKIRQICDEYNCFFISDVSHTIGLMLAEIIPNSFYEAHLTLGSTYKTIPAVRGGFVITQDKEIYNKFIDNLKGLQVERGLNLVTASYLGILECFSLKYKEKIKYSMFIAKYIEKFFTTEEMLKKGYNIVTNTELHFVTIKSPIDVTSLLPIFIRCNLDIGTAHIPGSDKYSLRFICTNVGILNYSLDDIKQILEIIIYIIDNFEDKNIDYLEIKEKVKSIAIKYPMFSQKNYISSKKVG